MSVVMSVLSCCRFTLWYCPIMLSLPWLLGVGLGLGFAEKNGHAHITAPRQHIRDTSPFLFFHGFRISLRQSREKMTPRTTMTPVAARHAGPATCRGSRCVGVKSKSTNPITCLYDTIRYDTIRDAILTCARKPT